MKFIIILFSITCFIGKSFAQAYFTLPKDTFCAGESFTPTLVSPQSATTYFWHFCSGNLNSDPSGENLGDFGELTDPSFIDIIEDTATDEYFGFVTNHLNKNIIRLRFGNSLLKTPVADNLRNFGDVIPDHVQGIQIAQSNGNWYVFIIGGLDNPRLVRLNFGNSLSNTPTITNFGDFGILNYPVDLYTFNENGTWFGFTVNIQSNSITRFNFGNDLANSPTASNLGNIGQLVRPFGICPVKEKSSNWHFFITNAGNNTISRIDFGSSLLNNNPTGVNLGSSTLLNGLYDLAIVYDCENTFGFVANTFNNNLIRMDFPDGLAGNIIYSTVPNINGLALPHGMSKVYRADNEVFLFVTDMGNRALHRLFYQTCTEASIASSSDKNPPPVYYNNPGNYNISLIVDQGLSTEDFTCRNITVLPKPEVSIGNDTTICPENSVVIEANESFTSYLWNNGVTSQSIQADTAGLYWVEVTNENNCKDRDTLILSHYPDLLFLDNDTTFTLGEAIELDAGEEYAFYAWSTGETTNSISVIKPGTYAVSVKLAVGTVSNPEYCIFNDTINISLKNDLPNFITPNGDGNNDIWPAAEQPKLFFHYPEAEITILDRYGKTIAKFHGYDPGWDGTYNGKPVNPDTYWYVVDLKDGSKPITGSITVKR